MLDCISHEALHDTVQHRCARLDLITRCWFAMWLTFASTNVCVWNNWSRADFAEWLVFCTLCLWNKELALQRILRRGNRACINILHLIAKEHNTVIFCPFLSDLCTQTVSHWHLFSYNLSHTWSVPRDIGWNLTPAMFSVPLCLCICLPCIHLCPRVTINSVELDFSEFLP